MMEFSKRFARVLCLASLACAATPLALAQEAAQPKTAVGIP